MAKALKSRKLIEIIIREKSTGKKYLRFDPMPHELKESGKL